MLTRLFIILLFFVSAAAIAEETLRCGGKIVSTGMSMDEVRQYCGKPSSSSTEDQDVRSGNRVVGTTQVHTWHYNRGSGQRTAVLVFDQEKLHSISYENK